MTHQLTNSDRRFDDFTTVTGVVRHGDQRGRRLGFPTANLHEVGEICQDGVYVATIGIEPGGPTHLAVVSIGRRQTYYGPEGIRLLEAHLLGFTGNLYGRRIRVALRYRLRPQRRFDDSPALVRQLREDVSAAARWAVRSGFAHLIVTAPRTEWSKGRWGLKQRRLPEDRCRPTIRALERTELIATAAKSVPKNADPHQWVAVKTGLPVADIAWRLPHLKAP
ncbi:riboflavin kinase [Streptomyces sp. NPDC042319]|uniref:riboflavin kinase n=1 Tax=Streptomyces sp. NPDC042319 TaxID=3154332 RepID=UPI0033E7627E